MMINQAVLVWSLVSLTEAVKYLTPPEIELKFKLFSNLIGCPHIRLDFEDDVYGRVLATFPTAEMHVHDDRIKFPLLVKQNHLPFFTEFDEPIVLDYQSTEAKPYVLKSATIYPMAGDRPESLGAESVGQRGKGDKIDILDLTAFKDSLDKIFMVGYGNKDNPAMCGDIKFQKTIEADIIMENANTVKQRFGGCDSLLFKLPVKDPKDGNKETIWEVGMNLNHLRMTESKIKAEIFMKHDHLVYFTDLDEPVLITYNLRTAAYKLERATIYPLAAQLEVVRKHQGKQKGEGNALDLRESDNLKKALERILDIGKGSKNYDVTCASINFMRSTSTDKIKEHLLRVEAKLKCSILRSALFNFKCKNGDADIACKASIKLSEVRTTFNKIMFPIVLQADRVYESDGLKYPIELLYRGPGRPFELLSGLVLKNSLNYKQMHLAEQKDYVKNDQATTALGGFPDITQYPGLKEAIMALFSAEIEEITKLWVCGEVKKPTNNWQESVMLVMNQVKISASVLAVGCGRFPICRRVYLYETKVPKALVAAAIKKSGFIWKTIIEKNGFRVFETRH